MSNEQSMVQRLAVQLMEVSKREREMGDLLHDAVLKIAALELLNDQLVAAAKVALELISSEIADSEFTEQEIQLRAALAAAGVEL